MGESRPGMFIVDSDPNAPPDSDDGANPTVSLLARADPPDRSSCWGCFVVGWNAETISGPDEVEIHVQYFDSYWRSRFCSDGACLGTRCHLAIALALLRPGFLNRLTAPRLVL